MMTRREAMKMTALVAAACASGTAVSRAADQGSQVVLRPPFSLPPLPYPADALEPYIDARTMEIHHDRHHAGYVSNLTKALSGVPGVGNKPLEDILSNLKSIPENIRTAVRNNGGGHYNHSLFWQMMKKNGGGEPRGELKRAIEKSFGSFSAFKEKFTEAATKVFGSGWAWLVPGSDGQLTIAGTANQDSPIMADSAKQPLLGVDVWEHAYYLKYQNRRADYVNAWFNVIDWDFVADRYSKVARG